MKRVTAAIMIKDKKLLIAQRKEGESQEFKWELPGGKIQNGETPEVCLERELHEEFGISTKTMSFFDKNIYKYDNGEIELIAYFSEHKSGDFELRVHQDIKWISFDDILDYDYSPADIPIIENLHSFFKKGYKNV